VAACKPLGNPASGFGRLIETVRWCGLDDLRAVLACTFTFDAGYFEQMLEALASEGSSGADHLRAVPVDVVCDHRHYRGHGGGYNVHTWSGSNLFHPKLLVLLFRDRIAWLEGSQNLTRSGYAVNQELSSFHVSLNRRLPSGVYQLISRLAKEPIEAARAIRNVATRGRTERTNRSATSLDGALLTGLLARVPLASEVYLVSPFFDVREKGGPSVESSALKRLVNHYPDAKFHVFAPEITTADGTKALQGSRKTFSDVFGVKPRLGRLALRGVPSDREPLHAKLVAVRHGHGESTVTVLTGSPNITERALLKKGDAANVELAREFTLGWAAFQRLMQPVWGAFRRLEECQFERPPVQLHSGWHAVASATYRPLQHLLEIRWVRPEKAAATQLVYAGRPLHVTAGGRCQGFVLVPGEMRLETVRRDSPSQRSWCPIVVPLEARLAIGQMPDRRDLPPEWWLGQLGSLPAIFDGARMKAGVVAGVPYNSNRTDRFELATRVRDLANRMRYVAEVLSESAAEQAPRVRAHLELLELIFHTHDPDGAPDPQEQTWRLWVRLEVVQLLEAAASRPGCMRGTASAARRLRQALVKTRIPAGLEGQWHALAG
jgi:hypothetical protein